MLSSNEGIFSTSLARILVRVSFISALFIKEGLSNLSVPFPDNTVVLEISEFLFVPLCTNVSSALLTNCVEGEIYIR